MKNEFLNLENFMSHKYLSGDIFWNKKSGKKLLVGQTGTLCNLDFVEKLITRGEEVEFITFINHENVASIKEALIKLRSAKVEDERVEARDLLVPLYREVLLNGTKESSLIEWSSAVFEIFYDLDKSKEELFIFKNSFLLERQVLIASLMLSSSIFLGYLDFNFLKDLYNKTLLTDLDLAKKSLSSFHFQEFENLRLRKIFKLTTLCEDFADHGNEVAEGEYDTFLTQINKYHHGFEREDIKFANNEHNELTILRALFEKNVSQIALVFERNDAVKFIGSILNKEDFSKKQKVMKLLNYKEVS